MPQTGIFSSHGVLTTMLVAICGGATWAAICYTDMPPGTGDLHDMIRLTTVAAALGGAIAWRWFGNPGPKGLVFALAGAVLATTIGSALAAAVIGGAPGLFIGPVFVLSSLATEPHVGGIWLLIMATAHCLAETERAAPQV